ncbi:MAG TPA: PQQ-binding-like beta-propeller repeat protein [Verrucomicrobiae bacterium]
MKTDIQTNSMVLILGCAFGIAGVAEPVRASDWPQWRGPDRNGVSSETGLLREWPQAGPRLKWQAKEVGFGYAAPTVVGERIYLLGNEGLEKEFVQALAVADGRRIWLTRLGNVGNPKQEPNFPAARSTPTVDGEVLYALGSDGDLACVETDGGRVRWQKSLRTDFGGKPGDWAYSESPLVDGDVVICTPGGADATLVALNKKTGDVVWKCAVPGADAAAYTSAVAVETAGVKQYVQMLQGGLVGVEAKTAKFLWRYKKTVSQFKANIPTPVAHGNLVYSAGAGTGGGAVKLVANGGTLEPEQIYFSPKLPTAIGGCVLLKNYLYGAGTEGLLCVDFTSGNVKWSERAAGAASLCYADDRLYLHGENGEVALVEPAAEGYREKGRFSPPDQPKRKNQMEKAWAYPVVANGCLYVRDHNMLWCYNVRADRQASNAAPGRN